MIDLTKEELIAIRMALENYFIPGYLGELLIKIQAAIDKYNASEFHNE